MISVPRRRPSNRPARPNPSPRRRAARPGVDPLEGRSLLTTLSGGVQLDVSPVSSLSSYAGVGFRLNPVADISGYVNNAPDTNPGDYQAQVHWGDGSAAAASLAAVDGTVLVKGTHVYKQQGIYDVTVDVTGPDGSTAGAQTCVVDVAAMPEAASQPIAAPATYGGSQALGAVGLDVSPVSSLSAYAGVGFRLNPIASISCSYNNAPDVLPTDFHAQVNWGDSPTWDANTTLASVGGSVLVKGTHVYKQQGIYDVVVDVTGPDGQTAAAQTTVVDVTPMPEAASQPIAVPATHAGAQPPGAVGLNLSPESSLSAYAGVGFALNPVASISCTYNGGGDVNLGDFHAQVNWGDGPTWDGNTGLAAVDGTVLVKGTHIYKQQGIYHVVVCVTGPDGQTAAAQTTAVDASPMPDPGSQPITVPANPGGPRALGAVGLNLSPETSLGATAGEAFAPAPIAAIICTYNEGPDVSVGDFHAQVNWGDTPTWDAGTTLTAEGGFVEVRGSHTYQQPGLYHVVVYVTGPDGQTAAAQTTAVDVQPAPRSFSLTPLPGDAFSVRVDQGIGFPIATVSYTGPMPTGLTGRIDDGDGTSSTPSFVPQGGAQFAVYDPDVYRRSAVYDLGVYVQDQQEDSGNVREVAYVEGVPDLIATSLTCAPTGGAAELRYQVAGAASPAPPAIAVYWATGTTYASRIGGAIDQFLGQAAVGVHGPVTIPASLLARPPAGAKDLIAVLDPLNQIAESDEFNNVAAMKLMLLVASATGTVTYTTGQIESILPITAIKPTAPRSLPPHATRTQVTQYNRLLAQYKVNLAKYGTARAGYDARVTALVDFFNTDEAKDDDLNTPLRVAAFLSQVGIETGNLRTLAQDGTFPNPLNQGRGYVQITGSGAYASASAALFPKDPTKLVNNPGIVASDPALGARVSGYYWKTKDVYLRDARGHYLTQDPLTGKSLIVGHTYATVKGKKVITGNIYRAFSLSQLADRGDILHLSIGLNGGTNGLSKRESDYAKAIMVLTMVC